MVLTIKAEFANRVMGFGHSAIPLGQRSQQDRKVLLILAYTAGRADYVAMFVNPPTLAQLLEPEGNNGGGGVAIQTLSVPIAADAVTITIPQTIGATIIGVPILDNQLVREITFNLDYGTFSAAALGGFYAGQVLTICFFKNI